MTDDDTPDEFAEFAQEQDHPTSVTTGDLRDGESVVLAFTGPPEMFTSEQYGDGFRVPALFGEADYEFRHDPPEDEDGPGPVVEEGDEVRLVSWGKRLARALKSWRAGRDSWHGAVEITAVGPPGSNGRDYQVEDWDGEISESDS